MVKASATIIILLILFCSLACEARVRLISPDLLTHKVEKLQQQQKRISNPDPRTIEAHIELMESYESFYPHSTMIRHVVI